MHWRQNFKNVQNIFAFWRESSNFQIIHYDGDEIRNLFGENFGFTEENRSVVIKTLVYLANKANKSGIPVIVSALTAHDDAREYVKSLLNLPLIPSVPNIDCILFLFL